MVPPAKPYDKTIPPRASPSHLSAQCHSTILTVTASLPDNHLESAYKYLSPRLDPHTAGIASGRRLRRYKIVERAKKCRLGGYGPPRMTSSFNTAKHFGSSRAHPSSELGHDRGRVDRDDRVLGLHVVVDRRRAQLPALLSTVISVLSTTSQHNIICGAAKIARSQG